MHCVSGRASAHARPPCLVVKLGAKPGVAPLKPFSSRPTAIQRLPILQRYKGTPLLQNSDETGRVIGGQKRGSIGKFSSL
jgi:hypothetical protein